MLQGERLSALRGCQPQEAEAALLQRQAQTISTHSGPEKVQRMSTTVAVQRISEMDVGSGCD